MFESKNALFALLGAIFGSTLAAIVSLSTNNTQVSVKYVEIATGILSSQSKVNNKILRTWAVDVLNENSKQKIPDALRQLLIDGEVYFSSEHDTLEDSVSSGTSTVTNQ